MPADRTGPLLRVEARCEGCPWLRSSTTINLAGRLVTRHRCTEPRALRPGAAHRKLGRSTVTPSWCPRMCEALLSLGRRLVAEGEAAEVAALEAKIARRSVFHLGEPR